ncbi:MAG TPA: sulfatase [Solirubrobacterales bacterium]
MRRALSTIALLAALAVPAAGPASAAAKQAPRPNVVMILTDDQTLADYNARSMPRTQKLLGGTGTTFSEAIVTTPLCCPSRASLITGQYGHNNGVLRNNYDDLRQKESTLPAWLARAGYTTIHVGKFMNQYAQSTGSDSEVAPGWKQWHSVVTPRYYHYDLQVNGRTRKMGSDPDDYLGRVLEETSVKMVERHAPRRKPFFLELDEYAPHISVGDDPSGRCENGAVPDPADSGLFADEPLPMPPNFNEADVSDKPSFMQGLPPLDPGSIDDLATLHRCSLASLASVDRAIARIHKAVKRAGELDETAFVFLSDNGFYAGEHRIPVSKQNPYEEGIRVPMVWSAPRGLVGRSPAAVDLPVANIDVPATILDLAGAEPCASGHRRDCRTLDGRSLVPLLKGNESAWPEDRALVVELDRGKSPVESDGRACDYTGVRTTSGILLEHRGAIDPAAGGACVPLQEFELYDLAADPFQLSSIHSTVTGVAPTPLEADLSARLAKLGDCKGIRGRDPRPGGGRTWCE